MRSNKKNTAFAHSAVIVLLDSKTQHLVLTKRTIHLSSHPGEVCFPGGRWQEGDESLYATALRELGEELGIEPERIKFLKELNLETTLPGTTILPCLAEIDGVEPYIINQVEVEDVLFLPLIAVQDPSNYRKVVVEKYGITISSLEFIPTEYFIWGATARILKQLVEK